MNHIARNEHQSLNKIYNFIQEKLGCDYEPKAVSGFQRFPAPNKGAKNKACWLIIDEDLKHATCGNFITDEKHTWHADDFSALSKEERKEARRMTAERMALSEAERQKNEALAAKQAKALFKQSPPANSHHSYLTTKHVKPYELRQDGVRLLVPLFDEQGEICSLQTIHPDGSKLFLPGGRTKGAYSIVGQIGSTDRLYACEGWATAATIHQEMGYPVIAAMTANNLLPVCQFWRTNIEASTEIIVVADNDHRIQSNPGVTKAQEAAEAIGATLITPPLPCLHANCKCTDFNDLSNCHYSTWEKK